MKLNYSESRKWKWVCGQQRMILVFRDMPERPARESA
jgi:hypothetical protein